jgi:hypothetical protein
MRRLRAACLEVVRQETTGLPLEVLRSDRGTLVRALHAADRLAVSVYPTLFGYQFVCLCEVTPTPSAE